MPAEHSTASVYKTGGSQAVRLPVEYRFEAGVERVFVRRDEATGDVILSTRPPKSFAAFEAILDELRPSSEELESFNPRSVEPDEPERDPFAGWTE